METPPLKIFIIYAHEDKQYKDELLKSLKLLQKLGLVEAWHDRDLVAGDDWDKVIRGHLETAHLILPIISIDFFHSDYIEQVEIEEAFRRYERREAHILPVIARRCKWTDDPRLSKLQALPENGLPIANWGSRDDAFDSIYDGIKGKILEIHEEWKAAEAEKQILEADAAAFSAARSRADFEAYLKKYKLHAAEARQKIDFFKKEEEKEAKKRREKEAEQKRLADETAWQTASRTGTEAAFKSYLAESGYTLHRKEAEQRLHALVTERQKHEAAEKQRAAAAERQKREAEIRNKYFPELVLIKGGTFEMGDTFGDGYDREKPVHTVRVSDFYLGKYAVTFKEYDLFGAETKKDWPDDRGWGRGKHPVINVSWEDAQAYCAWLSGKTGFKFRLPTEAEWEYAAREGGKNIRFGNGGNRANPAEINFNANKKYKQPYSVVGEYREKSVPVGSLNCPNSLGLHDMSGNVWEWCEDWHHDSYKNAPSDGSAWLSPISTDRVLRGGSWGGYPQGVRASFRYGSSPSVRSEGVGFRLARTI